MDQAAVRMMKSIVANSENVRSRIEKYYRRYDATVISPGIDYRRYRNRGDEKFFFYPSRFSPNKRQEMAIDAFRRFKAHRKGYRLVLAGPLSKDRFYDDYYNAVKKEANHVGNVKILHNVDDATLADLYSRCTAVLYPPMNEDFGIVPLEAMASSKPVIAMSDGGPKETVDGAGTLVRDGEGMVAAMKWVIDNPDRSEEMGRIGRKRVVARYSWASFFRKFDRALKSAADA
jgi:glycosyltransferase involved in cell wall biosynthesis